MASSTAWQLLSDEITPSRLLPTDMTQCEATRDLAADGKVTAVAAVWAHAARPTR